MNGQVISLGKQIINFKTNIMKAKDLFSITLKIIGLIAFWKSIQAFGEVIIGIGVFSVLSTNDLQEIYTYMLTIGLAMILNFVLPLLVGIIFVFKTKKVLSIIRIDELNNIDLNVSKRLFYHVLIIAFGLIFIIHGSGNFIDFEYKTDTKTEYFTDETTFTNKTTLDKTNQEKVTVTHSKNTIINYFALVEIIIGIILLVKATDISKRFQENWI